MCFMHLYTLPVQHDRIIYSMVLVTELNSSIQIYKMGDKNCNACILKIGGPFY